jgi:6-pyruvoyl-tetrahydropterin synthase
LQNSNLPAITFEITNNERSAVNGHWLASAQIKVVAVETGTALNIASNVPAACVPASYLFGSYTFDAVIFRGRTVDAASVGALRSVEWAPSPFVQHTWNSSMPDHAIVTEHFEFSAAHRLHCPDLGDEENRRIFGKCNHASGHGHNYRGAVSVRVPVGAGSPVLGAGQLASIVNRRVIDRFDHRHLNVDCPEFAALNPSVEHIAMVCHGLLEHDVAATGAALERVTVWETEKTSASYPARD